MELYAAYVEWMRARGCFVKNVTNWGRDLTSKGFEKKRKKDGVWYKGLRLAVGGSYLYVETEMMWRA